MINLSNHPSTNWPQEQIDAARELDGREVVDLPFPSVPTDAVRAWDIVSLARGLTLRLAGLRKEGHRAVMVAGEPAMSVALVAIVQGLGMQAFCAVTVRDAVEERLPDGSTRKVSVFRFQGFRAYPLIELV